MRLAHGKIERTSTIVTHQLKVRIVNDCRMLSLLPLKKLSEKRISRSLVQARHKYESRKPTPPMTSVREE